MFGSCSQPTKANKIISCGTRDYQHPIRTAPTKRWRLTISTHVRRPCELLANCEFALHGVRSSIFLTFNQNSSKKETTTYDSPNSTYVRRPCKLRICSSWRTELKVYSIQSVQQQQRDDNFWLDNLHSCKPFGRTTCELRICSSWKWLI